MALPRDLTRRWQRLIRLIGAGLLVAMGWIHWHLYDTGFSTVDVIGPLFLANAVLGALAAVALLATPSRWLSVVELGGGLLLLGTLAGLLLSLTVGLFGFRESWDAPLVVETILVETVGSVLLLSAAASHARPPLLERRSARKRHAAL